MDEATFRERVRRLEAINEALTKLDPAIRGEAFSLLVPYVTGETPGGEARQPANELAQATRKPTTHQEPPSGATTLEDFFSQVETNKPSDNVMAVAAYHYSQYGSAPLTTELIEELANGVGLTVPDRIDMTLVNAQRGGKNLFRRGTTRGTYLPTVHGEAFFKEQYKVKKGKKQITPEPSAKNDD